DAETVRADIETVKAELGALKEHLSSKSQACREALMQKEDEHAARVRAEDELA
ncbi:unnamed protein product, partial [Ascophyllum nodosum]